MFLVVRGARQKEKERDRKRQKETERDRKRQKETERDRKYVEFN